MTRPTEAAKRREARRAENAELASVLAKNAPGRALAAAVGLDLPKRATGKPGALKRKKRSPTLSKLKKLLWAEISRVVRSWSNVCLACKVNPTECAGHVVPANSGGATAYFLPNLIPMCFSCNGAELRHRGEWVYRFKEILGEDVVDALYLFNKESKKNGWQFKKWWVLEQTERMQKLC